MENKHGFDGTTFLTLCILSLVSAIGVLFFCLACFGVDISNCNHGLIAGFYWFTAAIIWILLALGRC